MLVGNLVAGKRIAQAIGRELGVVEDQDLIRKVLFLPKHDTVLRSSDPITLHRSIAGIFIKNKEYRYCLHEQPDATCTKQFSVLTGGSLYLLVRHVCLILNLLLFYSYLG